MKLVILDRDGVINHNTDYRVLNPEQWEPIPGSLEAIANLKKSGFIVVVATNQSTIANKMLTKAGLKQIHHKMQSLLMSTYNVSIDRILYCPHSSTDNCCCRKPKPGMLLEAAKLYDLDFQLESIPFVGDSLIDLQAASAANALPVLVKTGHGARTALSPEANTIKNVKIFNDLKQFAEYWLKVFTDFHTKTLIFFAILPHLV
jgi:D-glycero-D-manno-heptose 1,7-bisphosphate phosphatase